MDESVKQSTNKTMSKLMNQQTKERANEKE
jgi:hypothetical protein